VVCPPVGGTSGAVTPQLPLPPASDLLSSSRRQTHPSEAGRVACLSQEGATVRGKGAAVGSISRVRPRHVQAAVSGDDPDLASYLRPFV
jgi:hypothetical protein